MSELKNFLEDFQALLEQNEVEQSKVAMLKAQREELEAQIPPLEKRLADLKIEMEGVKTKALCEIKNAKDNFDRIIRQENDRLDEKYRSSEITEKWQNKTEDRQRQIGFELTERERVVTDREAKLILDRAKLEIDKKELLKIQEQNALKEFELKQQKEDNDRKLEAIRTESHDLIEQRHILKQGIEELHRGQEELGADRKKLNESNEESKKERQRLQILSGELIEKEKNITTQIAILDKKIKDNSDKERALQAMSAEIDFKLAKLKKAEDK